MIEIYRLGKTAEEAGTVMTPNDQGESTTCSRPDLFFFSETSLREESPALRPVFIVA